jgi:hypothetical protein
MIVGKPLIPGLDLLMRYRHELRSVIAVTEECHHLRLETAVFRLLQVLELQYLVPGTLSYDLC